MHSNPPRRLTRRSFVASLAGGAGLTVLRPRCLWAAGRTLPAVSFVVVSDTHLGYRDRDDAAKQWARTTAEIDRAEGDFVLHLGDVVDGGREAQYPVYLEHRRRIKKPIREIPGNHDPQELFEKHVRRPVDAAFDHKWLRVLLVGNARTDSHDGFLSRDQIAWIDEECRDAAANEMYVAIAMHVPAHTNRHPDRGWHVKPAHGQKELYETLARHRGRVLALMHGHFHNGIRGWDDHGPLHEIVFPSALYNRDRRLQEQKAPGYNLDEFRPGYTLVTIRDGAMSLRYKPLGIRETAEKRCRLGQLGGKGE